MTSPPTDVPQTSPVVTPETSLSPMERLVGVVQELSLARSLDKVMEIVRRAARELSGADGAAFVLREGDCCYYADEDAILPLWKGQRFQMETCISGMAMKAREPIVIPDIYADSRIPLAAYGPTFVKSLVMVPIRSANPIGAIGTYWSSPRLATPQEVKILQALADATSIAVENVNLYLELEGRVRERTRALEDVNRELETFSYSVSHDLRAPLRHADGFAQALLEDYADKLDEEGRSHLQRIQNATQHMGQLIEALLQLARVNRTPLAVQSVDLSQLAHAVLDQLRQQSPERRVDVQIEPGLVTQGDPNLLRVLLVNLLGNAWKFTGRTPSARIEVGALPVPQEGSTRTFFVADNGVGFDMAYASKLFGPFQRLHATKDFEGTGIGLATVQRVVRRHGGRIWAESAPNKGATFFFTLDAPSAAATQR